MEDHELLDCTTNEDHLSDAQGEQCIPVAEKYEYALARLGLKDSPPLRVIFWDAHDALEWNEETDWYITPPSPFSERGIESDVASKPRGE